MNIDLSSARRRLQDFDFRNLFVQELNWSHCTSRPLDLIVDGKTVSLTPLAEMSGMVVYQAELADSDDIPSSTFRRKLENQVKQITHEHIVIFVDSEKQRSVWQWIKRGGGQQTATREYTYNRGQPGDLLLQKLNGIALDIEDFDSEGRIAVVKVLERVAGAFDVERVTKRFYDEFKRERDAFSRFLAGIKAVDDLGWYASVMLNRLMFIYFIQKKGFLNGDVNYLVHKLEESKSRSEDRFYRDFLMPLFFQGFALEEGERPDEIRDLLGNVPYLNGGLFLPHQLERTYGEEISIGDAAFERLFTFFEKYNWHLDYRPMCADNEINPDVLGYIFEKYINQKEMGAYYTKEDITDYICKNTIIPFLFDKLENMRYEELHPFPMKDIEPYIYQAVKQEDFLPTETEREYGERQRRYQRIKDDFVTGKISTINDLITCNLDIRKFAEDWAAEITDPLTLRAFYFHCLNKVTVLDPAAGSGAFLFAALNLLEPLYEICLGKMEELGGPGYEDFAQELERVNKHPNREYFILKSIIVNNLYGVDIMEEAVEICKLRLFLKLVAQVDDVDSIEPLPDIDFNIRAGNSLVGYTSADKINFTPNRAEGQKIKMDLYGDVAQIENSAANVERSFKNFRELQIEVGVNSKTLANAKSDLRNDLEKLEDELNRYLAGEYGVDIKNIRSYEKWLKTHQPFHWFIEFYGILKNGGFSVIIGNPPYVEYSKVLNDYSICNYVSESCGNLYAYFVERNSMLVNNSGRSGMIVPHSSICTDRMSPIQNIFNSIGNPVWVSTYCIRPSKLFVGVDQRLAIFIMQHNKENDTKMLYSSKYHRWNEDFREYLFPTIQYTNISTITYKDSFPKMEKQLENDIWRRITEFSSLVKLISKNRKHFLYFHNAPRYWIRAINFAPYFWNEREGEHISTQVKPLYFSSALEASVIVAVLNSSLFYWWFILLSDCRHLNMREIERFPLGLDKMEDTTKQNLAAINKRLMDDYKLNARRKECYYKTTGKVIYDEFYPKYSKSIINEIDRILAKHYGFTEEELDFVINYDIKYRMGRGDGEDE